MTLPTNKRLGQPARRVPHARDRRPVDTGFPRRGPTPSVVVAKPSNADLDRIAPHLFLFQDDAATRLPTFVTDAALAAAFQPVISDERFNDLAFAVVQHRAAGLRAFAHQPDQSWDIGSAGKITILLGALTVLRDVETLDQAGLLVGVSDQTLDAWYRHVWLRHPNKAVRALVVSPNYPQVSRIVTRTGGLIRLNGGYTIDFTDLATRAGDHIGVSALGGTSFSERLHLAIGRSDVSVRPTPLDRRGAVSAAESSATDAAAVPRCGGPVGSAGARARPSGRRMDRGRSSSPNRSGS